MHMSSGLSLLCFFPLIFSCAYSWEESPSPYEALQQYGFPAGLLPQGAIGYDLNPGNGEFSAYLTSTCDFMIRNFQIRYESTISGVVSEGRLGELRGVSVKMLILWLNVVEVRRNGENLQFSIGFTSANFPVDDFAVSPKCGSGFDRVSAGGDGINIISQNLHLST